MSTSSKPNRLAKEKSPYLLQHAYNPVNWFPWSDEAFEIAKRDNKPIFLSIGYSTCHWCHAMERESFEDEEVAEVLNRDYVSIKVDREERPDVDHIYMSICETMTGHGGWPLTILMTPDQRPFFAGTYLPKEQKFGRVGLLDLLSKVGIRWKEQPDELMELSEQVLTEHERQDLLAGYRGELDEQCLNKAFHEYSHTFDHEYGGFGEAPKFPSSHNLSFLLRYAQHTGNQQALEMVEKTLDAMSRGGIYDHVGMGFSRYSVDEKWLVPHFEKMLYDNALLAITYTEAWQVTGKRLYRQITEQIFTYIARDMTDVGGAFYSAEDADSEGEEGRFYVWSDSEIKSVLGDEDAAFFNDLYGITPYGNFEGHNIPNLIDINLEAYANKHDLTEPELEQRVSELRAKLFTAREQRVHPQKDDKILTSWNGLMIAALAKAGQAFGDTRYTEQARKAETFLWNHLRRGDGRLLARYRDGQAAYPGYVDDYAFYVWGLIELYQTTFDVQYLRRALTLNQNMIDLFWDEERDGLFFTGSDSEQLISRPKEIYDGAIPSGNSIAAHNFVRLARLTGETRLEDYAAKQFKAFGGMVAHYPSGYSALLSALLYATGKTKEIVIVGQRDDPQTAQFVQVVQAGFRPDMVVIFKDKGQPEIAELAPYIHDYDLVNGKPAVYVCEHFACQAPVTHIDDFKALLDRME
ncbi:thioredoxin domain-containing protein [Paenibacillus polymyxa]|uniref:thioredoxin domain-containing protein n=1 Tax=Paenibacillus polymyxa TaxID=1406 RepID=UPI002ED47107|nr:thioredoxin domain-containing protein [Paenibacillus polymyxa]